MEATQYTWSFGQLIVGLLVAGLGFVLVYKADWMLQNFGSVPFAEKHMRTEGGSRLFYKLIGILIMVGGMMHATGLLAPFMGWAVDKIFGRYFGSL
jgi:hypothetical protein